MSDSDSSSPPPPSHRILSMLFPFLLRHFRTTAGSHRNQIIIFDHTTWTSVIIEGQVLDSLLQNLSEKSEPLPASMASIDAMPRVEVTELGMDCAICLDGFEVGQEFREMPCKHIYHSDCIQKWLMIRGTCPICRFSMPVEDDRGERKDGGDDNVEEEEQEEEEGRVVVVNLSFMDESEAEIIIDVEVESSSQEQDPSSEGSL